MFLTIFFFVILRAISILYSGRIRRRKSFSVVAEKKNDKSAPLCRRVPRDKWIPGPVLPPTDGSWSWTNSLDGDVDNGADRRDLKNHFSWWLAVSAGTAEKMRWISTRPTHSHWWFYLVGLFSRGASVTFDCRNTSSGRLQSRTTAMFLASSIRARRSLPTVVTGAIVFIGTKREVFMKIGEKKRQVSVYFYFFSSSFPI